VASPKQWAAIRAEKYSPCRLLWAGFTHNLSADVHMHHLVSRARGGDDVADNIVSLCETCHKHVTENDPAHLSALADNLTGSEVAYVVSKLGESAMQRLFGV
jgi:5-methylcytosine-specific restriction endonuclease McrA